MTRIPENTFAGACYDQNTLITIGDARRNWHTDIYVESLPRWATQCAALLLRSGADPKTVLPSLNAAQRLSAVWGCSHQLQALPGLAVRISQKIEDLAYCNLEIDNCDETFGVELDRNQARIFAQGISAAAAMIGRAVALARLAGALPHTGDLDLLALGQWDGVGIYEPAATLEA